MTYLCWWLSLLYFEHKDMSLIRWRIGIIFFVIILTIFISNRINLYLVHVSLWSRVYSVLQYFMTLVFLFITFDFFLENCLSWNHRFRLDFFTQNINNILRYLFFFLNFCRFLHNDAHVRVLWRHEPRLWCCRPAFSDMWFRRVWLCRRSRARP